MHGAQKFLTQNFTLYNLSLLSIVIKRNRKKDKYS